MLLRSRTIRSYAILLERGGVSAAQSSSSRSSDYRDDSVFTLKRQANYVRVQKQLSEKTPPSGEQKANEIKLIDLALVRIGSLANRDD